MFSLFLFIIVIWFLFFHHSNCHNNYDCNDSTRYSEGHEDGFNAGYDLGVKHGKYFKD